MLFDLPDHDTLYQALVDRDAAYDGQAYVCVSSTGVFCRLTCPARKPKPENCTFFATVGECIEAGYRACKRCHPLEPIAMADPAAARRIWRLDLPEVAISALHWLSKALFPFGSDRGGMQVSVVGHLDKKTVRRVWTLVTEDGDGPFVPGIVCRALLRRADRVRRGARACLAEVPRGDVEKAMSDLTITTHTFEERYPALFEDALDNRWEELPSEVQELHTIHDVESFSGKAEVTRGKSLLARLAAFVFGFPHAKPSSDLTLTKTRVGHGEIWERTFDGKVFRSFCSPAPKPHRYRERFGPFTFEQDLPVLDGALHLPVRRGWFLGIPLPKVMLPKSDSREFVRDGVFHFDVELSAPLGGGLIVRYRGSLKPMAATTHPLP